jgi:signal transduction histidine kinase
LFSFFLEGYHDQWTRPAAENRFSYRNLAPGTYRLLVRCIDPYKNEGAPTTLLRIIIRPPFWKTWWFILLAAFTALSITALSIKKIQGARYRREVEALERRNAVVRERLRIAQDMHDDIGASLTQISILSEILKKQDQADERYKIIRKISSVSGRVIDELGEIIWAINPGNDNLSSFVSYLRQHVSEYLSNAGMTAVISFPDEVPGVTMSSEQRRNIYLVVKEALHNAVRHSGADRTAISLIWHDPSMTLRIEDNGSGFHPEERMNAGNGLPGMRKRIESLGGTFSIKSRPGEGTVIFFEVIVR